MSMDELRAGHGLIWPASMLVCPCRYGCYLAFQLRTHHDLFCAEDEDEEPVMTFPGALAVLAGITVTVAVCSE